jgi:HEAT repeat protein
MLLKKKQYSDVSIAELSVEQAIEDLGHPDAARRREAAAALHGSEGGVSPLIGLLQTEARPEVREAAIAALLSVASGDVIDFFIEQLRGDEANRRNEAVYALQQMPEQSADKIKALLYDSEPDVRIMAVDVVRMLTISKAAIWLRELLQKEDQPNVVGVTVDRLCEIGSIEDLPTLEQTKERFADDPYLQFSIDLAMKRIICLDAEEPI